jgi:poly-beta-1,6-N-acetyl-D-glucosamine synthase
MTWILFIALSLSLLYGLMILLFVKGFLHGRHSGKSASKNCGRFSVIVPARNEEKTISLLLQDLINQDFPKERYEILLVDDHSSDDTFLQASRLLKDHANLTIISLEDPLVRGKKSALAEGIRQAKYDRIVTTDGDCRIQPGWLSSISACFDKYQPVLLTGPVLLKEQKSFWHRLLALEQISLMFITAGSCGLQRPVMCSGANMAYEKSLFLGTRDPVKTITPSGEDMFLLAEAKKKHRKRIAFNFLKEGSVSTEPPASFRAFFEQRKRWVSKSRHYRDPDILLSGALVLVVSFLVPVLLIGSFVSTSFFISFLVLFSTKIVVDYLALRFSAKEFGRKDLLRFYLPAQGLHALYVLMTSIPGLAGRFTWKERRHKELS